MSPAVKLLTVIAMLGAVALFVGGVAIAAANLPEQSFHHGWQESVLIGVMLATLPSALFALRRTGRG